MDCQFGYYSDDLLRGGAIVGIVITSVARDLLLLLAFRHSLFAIRYSPERGWIVRRFSAASRLFVHPERRRLPSPPESNSLFLPKHSEGGAVLS